MIKLIGMVKQDVFVMRNGDLSAEIKILFF
jgi:hypothetical protein